MPPVLRRLMLFLTRHIDGVLLSAILLLMFTGLLVLLSASNGNFVRTSGQLGNMLVALGVMWLFANIPPHYLQRLALPVFALGCALLIGVALFGEIVNGARRWLHIGVTRIQPSELMKIAMPLMLAWWFQKREGQLRPLDFVVAALLLMVPVGLIMKQPDLGTALLVLSTGFAVLFFAGLSWRLILPPVLLGLVGLILLVVFESQMCADGVDWKVLHEYQRQRVCTLLDPARDPLGKGFHIIQGMIAIGSGGFWGKGFMQGTQTHLEFIPERTTDFIFAAFSEEFGLLGTLLLISGFFFLVFRGLVIAREAPSLFTRLLEQASVS